MLVLNLLPIVERWRMMDLESESESFENVLGSKVNTRRVLARSSSAGNTKPLFISDEIREQGHASCEHMIIHYREKIFITYSTP